jgi:hypothetical protein
MESRGFNYCNSGNSVLPRLAVVDGEVGYNSVTQIARVLRCAVQREQMRAKSYLALKFAFFSGKAGGPFLLGGFQIGYFTSFANLAYIMNVGSVCDSDMSTTPDASRTLVHEMTHVWQGKHSLYALTLYSVQLLLSVRE